MELGTRSRTLVGWAVALCVLAAVAAAVPGLRTAVLAFDRQSAANADRSSLDRLAGEPHDILGSQKLLESAQARMPEDASFAVVLGPRLRLQRSLARPLAPEYLTFLLLPRRRVAPRSADWLFCYGCDRRSLHRRFEVLFDAGHGILFGRLDR